MVGATSSSSITLILDVVCFIYGLALIVLGSTIFAFNNREDHRSLVTTLPFLAAFAILHGLHEWFNLWSEHPSIGATFVTYINALLMSASYLALLEFGRRLVLIGLQKRTHYLLSGRLYIPLFASLLVGSLFTEPAVYGLAFWSAYLFGFTGAILSGVGLMLYYRHKSPSLAPLNAKPYFLIAATAFFVYSLIEGLFVPSSHLLNPALRAAEIMVPITIIHTTCAVTITLALIRLMQLFSVDSELQRRTIQSEIQNYLDRSGTLLLALDRHGEIIWVNSATCDALGTAYQEMMGQDWLQTYLAADSRELFHQKLSVQETTQTPSNPSEFECSVITHSGLRRDVTWNATPLSGSNGAVYGVLYSGQESSESQEKKRLELQQQLALKVFHNMPEGVVVTDKEGIIMSVNPTYTEATGYTAEEALGQHVRMLKSGHHDKEFYEAMWEQLLTTGHWQGEIWNRRKDGEIFPEWLTISALKDDNGVTNHYAGIFSDINTQQHVQQRLQRLAYYDTLTGLPNRAHFYDYLEQELHRAKRDGTLFGVMFLDFDRFKNINDTLGHSVGDEVLKSIAIRLKESIRESDTVARLGGDEFVVLLPELNEARHAVMVADKLMGNFVEPVTVQNKDLFVTASVGISIYPFDGDDGETLIKNADTAMYHSKELGRNKYHFYTSDMSARFRERLDLENGFRRALENDELYLVYQPQFDVRTNKIIGIEALARWQHPDFGNVPPSRFIALAEDSGMIGHLGEWVLRTACYQAKQWATLCDQPFRVAINISAHQLLQHGLCEIVEKLIEEHALDANYLELELTESVLMQHADTTTATLQRLSNMGIELSIDDFGTGYSSLSYLKRFAIDKLKIDRSFVKDVPHDANDSAIAATVIAMARNLNLEVIAEGVETEEQSTFLRKRGCYIMQGELYSAPIKAVEITRMLLNNHPKPVRKRPVPA